jgi:hypothetical protein
VPFGFKFCQDLGGELKIAIFKRLTGSLQARASP